MCGIVLGNGDSKISGIWFRPFEHFSTMKKTCLYYGAMIKQGRKYESRNEREALWWNGRKGER